MKKLGEVGNTGSASHQQQVIDEANHKIDEMIAESLIRLREEDADPRVQKRREENYQKLHESTSVPDL